MKSITNKVISCIVFITGLVIFCLFLPVRSFGQTTIKAKKILTPNSVWRTAAMKEPILYVAHHNGIFKILFEQGLRKSGQFNKETSLTITVTDSTGKKKFERKYYPGDYFPSFITGDLSPDCPDTWYLYGKGPFEWDSGVTGKAIDDARVFSLDCSSDYAQQTNKCKTTNYGNLPYLDAKAWTWNGDPAVMRSYLRFNGLNFTGTVRMDTAILSLYESGRSRARSGSNAFTVSAVAGPWDENTLNWQNKPGAGSPSVPGPAGTGNAFLDVTPIVRFWLANPNSNYGFRLALQKEPPYRNRGFYSSEGSKPPHLMVKVSNPSATIDTLIVTDVKKGDEITLDYAANGNVISTITTGLTKEINGKQVAGQQYDFKISDFSCIDHYKYSEQLKAFGWVDWTMAPNVTNKKFSPDAFLVAFISMEQRACKLKWIDNKEVCQSLQAKLKNVQKLLGKGKTIFAIYTLQAFLNELDAQKGKHLTSEGYGLLYFNGKYLMQQLEKQ